MSEHDGLVPESMKVAAAAASSSTNTDESGHRLKTMADYEVLREIGDGSFSIVYAAREREGQRREVAIKTCFKQQILKMGKVASVFREKSVLQTMSEAPEAERCPFVVHLYATFQDAQQLYFVLSYAKYGDLLHVQLKRPDRCFTKSETQFYAAELWAALTHIHRFSLVHLDVKPENVLVRADGHSMLSDFGCVRDLNEKEEKVDPRIRHSAIMPGTAQYVSPEILERGPVTPACDVWAFGVVVFQFLTGKHCFHDESEYLIFRRIQKLLYSFPEGFPADARDLVQGMLVLDPKERLGSSEKGGSLAVKSHAFFEGIDWEKLHEAKPPITFQ